MAVIYIRYILIHPSNANDYEKSQLKTIRSSAWYVK